MYIYSTVLVSALGEGVVSSVLWLTLPLVLVPTVDEASFRLGPKLFCIHQSIVNWELNTMSVQTICDWAGQVLKYAFILPKIVK